jgi:hypothetical protein
LLSPAAITAKAAREAERPGLFPQTEVHQADPGTLFLILRNGSLPTGTPSAAHLLEARRWQINAFLTSVSLRS